MTMLSTPRRVMLVSTYTVLGWRLAQLECGHAEPWPDDLPVPDVMSCCGCCPPEWLHITPDWPIRMAALYVRIA
jgi:hypothetical protein